MLNDLRVQLIWLRDEVLRAIREGRERGEIQQANLIPPTLARSPTSVHLAYLRAARKPDQSRLRPEQRVLAERHGRIGRLTTPITARRS